MFYKRRDYSKVIDGKNPIVAHEFLGNSVENKDVIIIDDKPFPTLKAALSNQIDGKTVTVDMGAIKFVSNGADIMSPGIVDASEGVEPGDIVLIIDETHGKPLAIGVSLIKGEEMVENDSGKAVETKHYVGDDIWNFEL